LGRDKNKTCVVLYTVTHTYFKLCWDSLFNTCLVSVCFSFRVSQCIGFSSCCTFAMSRGLPTTPLCCVESREKPALSSPLQRPRLMYLQSPPGAAETPDNVAHVLVTGSQAFPLEYSLSISKVQLRARGKLSHS
jgi:hypothetical protein